MALLREAIRSAVCWGMPLCRLWSIGAEGLSDAALAPALGATVAFLAWFPVGRRPETGRCLRHGARGRILGGDSGGRGHQAAAKPGAGFTLKEEQGC